MAGREALCTCQPGSRLSPSHGLGVQSLGSGTFGHCNVLQMWQHITSHSGHPWGCWLPRLTHQQPCSLTDPWGWAPTMHGSSDQSHAWWPCAARLTAGVRILVMRLLKNLQVGSGVLSLESVNVNSGYMDKWHATQKSTLLTMLYLKRKSYVEVVKGLPQSLWLEQVDGSCHELLEMGRAPHGDFLGGMPGMVWQKYCIHSICPFLLID